MSGKRLGWKIALLRIVGIILGTAGLAAGYFWFFYWGPLRHFCDPAWGRQHSEAAIWDECQICVHRSGWTHDVFAMVGMFGDKQWAQWIVDHVQSDDDFRGCNAGHKDHALRLLTNQDAGKSVADWRDWWERNKSKSQEDWIREGFPKYDVNLQTPLTPANTIALLKLAVYMEEKPASVPDYIQYNAFRWLRDSDFEPDKFTVKDMPADDADRVLHGLVRFARLSGESPKHEGVGVLKLGKPNTQYDFRPMMLEPSFQIMANAAIFVPLGTGLILLWLSFRLRHRERTSAGDIQEDR